MVAWDKTYQVIDGDTLRLAENAPMINPDVTMGYRDIDYVRYNNLVGKSFQFAYQWQYKDNRQSILSPYSDICVSRDLFKTDSNPAGDEENFITVGYYLGNSEVKKVRLLCREGNSGSWFVIYEYEKTESDVKDLVERGWYEFFNDTAREYIDVTSATATYHNVPLAAKNIEVVRDKVVLSNCVMGVDPVDVQYDLDVSYVTGSVIEDVVGVVGAMVVSPTEQRRYSAPNVIVTLEIPNVEAGGTISINTSFNSEWWSAMDYGLLDKTGDFYQSEFSFVGSLSFADATSPSDVVAALRSNLGDHIKYRRRRSNRYYPPLASEHKILDTYGEWKDIPVQISTVEGNPMQLVLLCERAYNPPGQYYSTPNIKISDLHNSSWVGKSAGGKKTFKSYSNYNVGIAYYDKVGRTSGVLFCDNKRVYVPGGLERIAADRGKAVDIAWTLSNDAPSWASYYRWCVSESVNLLSVFPIKTQAPSVGVTVVCYEIDYKGRAAIAIDYMGVGYTYTQGDYLVVDDIVGEGDIPQPAIIKPILGQEVLINFNNADVAGSFILVPDDGTDASSYEDKVMSIHRPKDKTEDYVFYEDAKTYQITNGVHSTTSGVISCGDAWWMQRDFSKTVDGVINRTTSAVEDFTINPMYGLRAYSQGRPMVSLKGTIQKRLQILAWGGTHFRDTETTEIAAFNLSDTKSMDAQFGEINGMCLVGDVLKVLQKKKETSIYVGKSVFTDAGGLVQLSQVDSLFGNINAYDTLHGTDDKRSVKVSGRSLYYWDQNVGSVIRSSPNGQIEISKLGMEKFFLDRRDDINTAIKNSTPYSVLCGLSPRFNELIVTFRIGTYKETVVFDEDNNRWMFFADYYASVGSALYTPDLYANMGNETLSFVSGVMYQHEKNNVSNRLYSGNSPVVITGVLNDNPAVEKVYKDMAVDADGYFYVSAETAKSSTCPTGMYTYNVPAHLRRKSGKYCAPFLRNVRVGQTNNSSLLYTGRQMQGKYAEITLTSTAPYGNIENTDKFEFREMAVNWLQV